MQYYPAIEAVVKSNYPNMECFMKNNMRFCQFNHRTSNNIQNVKIFMNLQIILESYNFTMQI